MTKVLITEDHLKNIAKAIRNKTGETTKYTPPEMAEAINQLETTSEDEKNWLAALNDDSPYNDADPTGWQFDTLTSPIASVREYLFATGESGFSNFHVYPLCKSLVLPNAIAVGNYAFIMRTFETLDAPNVETIGSYAFEYNKTMISVNLPKATDIKTSAFYDCYKLKSLSLPACNNIATNAFNGCTDLESVEIGGNGTISGSAFYGCKKLTTVNAPNIETIESSAFRENTLLAHANINGCKKLSGIPFWQCPALESIDLPSVVTIDSSGFSSCNSLKSVTIGSNCTSINYSFCNSCAALEEIVIQATTPPTLTSTPKWATTVKLYVPDESVDAYKEKTNWVKVADQIYGISERTSE